MALFSTVYICHLLAHTDRDVLWSRTELMHSLHRGRVRPSLHLVLGVDGMASIQFGMV